ncbi:hypothetical protein B0H14DRAFT_2409209 [Mycena olivaceomarginata]|nr:hypothetical protein B0H14DRAFT_2409209 [Mycena olivaceomarginata]
MHPAKISDCELINHEIEEATVSELIELIFDSVEQMWGADGSPYQKWYRSVATGKDAVVDKRSNEEGIFENSRLIAWKKGKPFDAENLFFRTVDTGRLLPMYLADFRMQFYAHTSFWERLDAVDSGRTGWLYPILSSFLHQILVLRNMHDKGGADVPFIVIAWDKERLERAMNYWADLSKGEWSEEEQHNECDAACRYIRPCFFQVDLLVRALLSDPEVGYVPPYIIFHSPNGKSCVLFTKPLHFPPTDLTDNLPTSCNSPHCTETECASLDMYHVPILGRQQPPGSKVGLCRVQTCTVQSVALSSRKLSGQRQTNALSTMQRGSFIVRRNIR